MCCAKESNILHNVPKYSNFYFLARRKSNSVKRIFCSNLNEEVCLCTVVHSTLNKNKQKHLLE